MYYKPFTHVFQQGICVGIHVKNMHFEHPPSVGSHGVITLHSWYPLGYCEKRNLVDTVTELPRLYRGE